MNTHEHTHTHTSTHVRDVSITSFHRNRSPSHIHTRSHTRTHAYNTHTSRHIHASTHTYVGVHRIGNNTTTYLLLVCLFSLKLLPPKRLCTKRVNVFEDSDFTAKIYMRPNLALEFETRDTCVMQCVAVFCSVLQ